VRTFQDYAGRQIRLTDERMEHIVTEHPEMVALLAIAEQTLAEPERVVTSLSGPDSILYYRSYTATVVGDKLACIVVKSIDHDPFILTAYFTDRVKKGDVIWPTK
jgi:hypothetical protein